MHLFASMSLRFKICAVFSAISVVAVSVFTIQAVVAAREDALRAVDAKLVTAARAAAFLLGPDSTYVTGQIIGVDGQMTV